MIKDLPVHYIKIHYVAPDITAPTQIALYYLLLGFFMGVTILFSLKMDIFQYGAGPDRLRILSWPETWLMVLFILMYFSGVLIHYILSLAVFRFFGKRAIYFSRRKAPSNRYDIKSLIPTWLPSVWVPQQAFTKNQYLITVIFPLAGALLILYGLVYLFDYASSGLGFQFLIAIFLVVFLYSSRIFLFLRLLLFPSSTYFVDRQSGLYIYDQRRHGIE